MGRTSYKATKEVEEYLWWDLELQNWKGLRGRSAMRQWEREGERKGWSGIWKQDERTGEEELPEGCKIPSRPSGVREREYTCI